MSKRNFILLIIILIIIVIAVFGFLYFNQLATTTIPDSGGTNFLSQFNPFSSNKPATTPNTTNPIDISGDQPTPGEEIPVVKLQRVSSMPIAGFAVFSKERLKDVPTPVTPAETAAPVIIYDFGTTTIKKGSTGEAVKEIQKFLNNILNLSLELNGVINTETITAIKQWQGDHGLVADGVVGAKTKALMYSSVNQKTEVGKPIPPPTEFMPALRYVDRASGNIYQTFADKIEEKKFSGTVIPKIYEAFFGNQGESVIMRYLKEDGKTIETFVGNLPKEILGGDTTANNEIKGTFLPEDTKDISLSSDTLSAFYLFNVGNNMVGTTLNLTTNKKVQIFTSPFTEWLSFWPNSKIITLTTKPSSGVLGYMYTMDGNGKNFNKIIGGVSGLTTLAGPDGKAILYGDNNLTLSVYHTDTKVSSLLGVKTLPEKCVWNKAGDAVYCAVPKSIDVNQYPDAWYQGEVSFGDQIWKIDVLSGNASMIADPATVSGGGEIDGIKLALDDGENYLFFVNKKDSFLWKLELK